MLKALSNSLRRGRTWRSLAGFKLNPQHSDVSNVLGLRPETRNPLSAIYLLQLIWYSIQSSEAPSFDHRSVRVDFAILFLAIVAILCAGLPTKAISHEVFSLHHSENPAADIPLPVLEEPVVYEDSSVWIFRSSSGQHFVVPKSLPLVRTDGPGLFGANIQSRRQDHLIVLLTHAVTWEYLQPSLEEFKTQTNIEDVKIYPFLLKYVVLVTDPQDHVVVKFNSTSTRSGSAGNQLMILSIIQSAGRSNVRNVKALFSSGVTIVAYVEIALGTSIDTSDRKILSIKMETNSINVTSQGL